MLLMASLFVCKTRRDSILHYKKNIHIPLSICLTFLVLILLVNVDFFNSIIGTRLVNIGDILIPGIFFGFVFIICEEILKRFINSFENNVIFNYFKW